MRMPWQKGDDMDLVLIRAAVMPHVKSLGVAKGVSDSNVTVNSVSTHFVTLQPLGPGESAVDVAPWEPGTINQGSWMMSNEEAQSRNLQRVQFNAPNWVSKLVVSHTSLYERHIDIPVWADRTGRIERVDVGAMLKELEPFRKEASAAWGSEEGIFADFHQIARAPKELFKIGKIFAFLPGELVGEFKSMKKDHDAAKLPAEPIARERWPDLSAYPPVDGMDYRMVVQFQAHPETIAQSEYGKDGRMLSAGKIWNERIQGDQKLADLFFSDVDRLRKGVAPSWDLDI